MSQNLFSETQRFRQVWVWLLMLAMVAIAWWAFSVQILSGHPFGDNPAPDSVVWGLFIVMGWLLPGLLLILRLETDVTHSQLRIAMRPIHSRRIAITDIKSATARPYRPLVEYGGWGIRWSPVHGWAYNVSGKVGVQLELTDGRKVLVGSQRADELARAINGAMGG
jgi:hypothetical protein